jgi:hypothetical protein
LRRKQAIEDTERESPELRAIWIGALRKPVADVASSSLLAEPKRLRHAEQAIESGDVGRLHTDRDH